MSDSRTLRFVAGLAIASLSLAAARCASGAPAGGAASSANPMVNLSTMLSGVFRGSTPGNELTLDIKNAGLVGSTDAFNLFVTASGRYQGTNVRDAGVLRVENQGQNVGITYIPHFDATVGGLSREALRFTEEELQSACNFVLAPRGDGYAGETLGATSCTRAIHGATGKWTIEVEQGAIRLRNAVSGETLRFQRASR